MNKEQYLERLKLQLSNLSESDINEIIRDQEEYINEGLRQGRAEGDIIKSLGDPTDLAKELKATSQIHSAGKEEKLLPKTNRLLKAIGATLVLTPFNLIFVLGPFCGLIGILVAFWSVSFTLGLMGLVFIPTSLITIGSGVTIFLFSLFTSIAITGFGILFLVSSYYLTLGLYKLFIRYLKWNVDFITGGSNV